MTYRGMHQADQVSEEVLAQLRRLRTPEGADAVRLAARLQDDGVDLLPGLARLRTAVGAENITDTLRSWTIFHQTPASGRIGTPSYRIVVMPAMSGA